MPPQNATLARQTFFSDNAGLIGLAVFYFLLLMAASLIGQHWGYGYFVDELYYIACAKRLAFGYVDHPPLSPFLLRLVLATLGEAIWAIRLLPALAAASTVFLTGRMAGELGAGKLGQCMAAVALMIAPVFAVMGGFYSMNPIETLLWTACGYVVILLIKQDRPRLWLLFGVLIGLGLLNKHTLSVYVVSLLLGLLLTPARKYLWRKEFWLGLVIAGILLAPNILWQIQHGFPSLEFYRNATLQKNIDTAPVKILLDQILAMNPVAAPIWLLGLGGYLFAKPYKPYRLLGWSYLFLLGTLLLSHSSRPDRILAAYPMLLAAGAMLLEQAVRRYRRRILAGIPLALLVIGGLVLMPASFSILPPALTIAYTRLLGLSVQIEKGVQPGLPQWFADRFEWENLVATVAKVYQTLSSEEQAQAVIFGDGYGDTGALELFGPKYHLPRVIAAHNSYYLWGPGETTGEVVIVLGRHSVELQPIFREVQQAETISCQYCRLFRYMPVYICKGLKTPLQELWPIIKNYQ